jgi:hypothetical protein
MTEFTVGGRRYSAKKLSAFEQFHVARKFGPILLMLGNAALGETEDKAKAKPKMTPAQEARAFAQLICTMAAPLSQADAETAINTCLSAVTRDQGEGKGFAAIRTPDGAMMFNDVELPELLEIVWHVLHINKLPDFFAASPSAPGAGTGQNS